ncbi:MAG TPA: hypothetical protein DD671_15180, partial [Balneolaceae bacterium]|nr:hypothetical protein [Balneolaceae bacterium]
ALSYFNEALEVNYQTERPVSIANNLTELALVARQKDDYDNAENFYREALNWLGETNSPQTRSAIYLDLAELELSRNNFSDTRNYIDQAKKLSDSKEFLYLTARSHALLGKLHQAKGDFSESLNEYRKV